MKNILTIMVLALSCGAVQARAAGALGTLTGHSASAGLPARAPEASAPVDTHFLAVNNNRDGYYFSTESSCREAGDAAALKVEKAGFQVLRRSVRSWLDNAGNVHWGYTVEYAVQAGMITPEFITYGQALDSNGAWYTYNWEAVKAAGEVERTLEEAGYIVLHTRARYMYDSAEHWGFDVTYTARAGRLAADYSVYEVLMDKNGQRFTSGFDADWAAQEFSRKLRAAGYFPLGRRLSAADQDGRRSYSSYVYYAPRAGRAPAEVQHLNTETDAGNGNFDMDYMATLAGEAVKTKLETAGYVVLESRLLWQPAYRRWIYQNVYVAPSSYSSNKMQTMILDKGADGRPYTGLWGQQSAKADGEAMAATLAAAGYTVLQGVTRPYWHQSDTWVHEISYIQPAK